MNTSESVALRTIVVDGIRAYRAHIDFESALEDFPLEMRGWKPAGSPHTAWQLLEHMRIAQWDILEFSRNPKHESPEWPAGYWPKSDAPPNVKAWDCSVNAFRREAVEFCQLIQELQNNLLEPFPYGEGQTLLGEALLVISHNSYHLGQLMYVKKSYRALDASRHNTYANNP
jgi:hypothetical protein